MTSGDKKRIAEIIEEDLKSRLTITNDLLRIMSKLHEESLCDQFGNAKAKRLGKILRPKFRQMIVNEIIEELSKEI